MRMARDMESLSMRWSPRAYARARDATTSKRESRPGACDGSGPACVMRVVSCGAASERGVVGLARTDTNDTVDIGDEDLAVADLAGLGGLQDGFDHLIDEITADSYFNLGFRDEVDD